jgi:hypothetical protein
MIRKLASGEYRLYSAEKEDRGLSPIIAKSWSVPDFGGG